MTWPTGRGIETLTSGSPQSPPAVPDAPGVGEVALLVVRPDRHIGFRPDRVDADGLRRDGELVLGLRRSRPS